MKKRSTKAKGNLPAPTIPPAASEQAAIDSARERVSNRAPRLMTRLSTSDDGKIGEIGPDHSDHSGWVKRLEDLFGSRGQPFPVSQLNHILAFGRDGEGKYDQTKTNALLAAIQGANPADELQAMLAVQMCLSHELMMQAMRRASRVDQIPQYESAAGMAIKLMRAYAGHLELLTRLQRGTGQTVRVEHVHVHAGGQAVVGNVTTRGRGADEIENQPHAPDEITEARRLTSQPGAPLPCHHAEGQPVPVASGER